MIEFSCQCGRQFREPDDAGGLLLQCPACQTLLDIPEPALLADSDAEPLPPLAALAPIGRMAVITFDGDLVETQNIALRSEPVAAWAEDELPAPSPSAIASIGYAPVDGRLSGVSNDPLLLLLRPMNLFVMAAVVFAHLMLYGGSYVVAHGMYLAAPFVVLIAPIVMAHYANVIDEIGVEGADELPRFLRELRMHEDTFWPFVRFALAFLLCNGPAAASLFIRLPAWPAAALCLTLLIPGAAAFPAVLLTLVISGVIENLRPDRLLGVARSAGPHYRRALALAIGAQVAYAISFFSVAVGVGLFSGGVPDWLGTPLISLPFMLVGIFLMHAFCWQLGLIYRLHCIEFPWIGRIFEFDDQEEHDLPARQRP